MSISAASIKQRYPEFSSLSDSYISLVIVDAALEVNSDEWLEKTDKGVQLMTAHLLALSQRASSGASGPLISERVGDLERQYGTINVNQLDGSFAQTKYGLEFVNVRKTISTSPLLF